MNSQTHSAIKKPWPWQGSRRSLLIESMAALGALAGLLRGGAPAAGRQAPGSRSGKRSRKKSKCRKPGDACQSHSDCCSKGGMCVELVQDGGDSSSRRCAAA